MTKIYKEDLETMLCRLDPKWEWDDFIERWCDFTGESLCEGNEYFYPAETLHELLQTMDSARNTTHKLSDLNGQYIRVIFH